MARMTFSSAHNGPAPMSLLRNPSILTRSKKLSKCWWPKTVAKDKKSTILIVDDDPQIRKMLILVLEDYKLIECDTGKCAARLSISAKPDLVLLDLNLPDMNGRDVVKALREW